MSNHIVSPRIYFIVFAALMVLMALTVVVTRLEHGLIADLVAMSIAIAKAVLIIMFFMHVKYSSHLTKLFAVAGFVWLLILFAFILSDYKTRQWEPTRHNYPIEQTFRSPTIGFGKQIARIISPDKFDGRPDGDFDNGFREGTLRQLKNERTAWLGE